MLTAVTGIKWGAYGRNQSGKIYSESATIRDSSSQCGVCSCGWYGS